MAASPFLIGCATGFSGDRTDGAQAVVQSLAARGGGTLIFETLRSEEHTSELQSLMRTSYAVLCLKKNNHRPTSLTFTHAYNNTQSSDHRKSQSRLTDAIRTQHHHQ